MKLLQGAATLFLGLTLFVSCSGKKVVEEKPFADNFGKYKSVAIEVESTDKKAEYFRQDLALHIQKRLIKAKVFESVVDGTEVKRNADLVIKADIYEAVIPDGGFKFSAIGEAKYQLNVRYTFLSNDKKILGAIQASSNSSSGGGVSVGGMSTDFTSDRDRVLGRNADVLVKYIKDKK